MSKSYWSSLFDLCLLTSSWRQCSYNVGYIINDEIGRRGNDWQRTLSAEVKNSEVTKHSCPWSPLGACASDCSSYSIRKAVFLPVWYPLGQGRGPYPGHCCCCCRLLNCDCSLAGCCWASIAAWSSGASGRSASSSSRTYLRARNNRCNSPILFSKQRMSITRFY